VNVSTIERELDTICIKHYEQTGTRRALRCSIGDIMEIVGDEPEEPEQAQSGNS
jgi:DNA-binding Xre family transcriptional regulator